MNRFESVTDETTSHSTKQPKDGCQVVGYRLPKDDSQVAGYKPLMWSMTLLLTAIVAGCGGGGGSTGLGLGQTGEVCTGASCVSLGTAGKYAILAKTAITNTPTSAITGNLGLSPNAASGISGFALNLPAGSAFSTSAQVTGRVYASDYAVPTPANLTTAVSNMEAAYTAAAGLAPAGVGGCPGTGIMSGITITPGVYTCSNAVTITGSITLSGTATDVWVFQFAQTLTQSAATHVNLTGGALPQNVFWQVAGGVTIETTALMQGVILGQTAINLQTGATVKGRLLAQTAVNLDANTVTVP